MREGTSSGKDVSLLFGIVPLKCALHQIDTLQLKLVE